MNQENDFTKMLKEVGITAEIVGVSNLTSLLKYIQKNHKEINEEDYKNAMNVIEVVCKNYNITIEDFYSNKRKNDRRYALGTVCYILNKKMNFKIISICYIVKKAHVFVYGLVKQIEELDEKHPSDRVFVKKLNNIISELKLN